MTLTISMVESHHIHIDQHMLFLQEVEQRHQRLRNLRAELLTLQRLEVVHLDRHLDAQARAGKQGPVEQPGFKHEASLVQ